jgi:hypothetical protein
MRDLMASLGGANSRRSRRRWLRLRPAIDAAAALGLFVLISLTIASAPTSANPQIPAHATQFTMTVPAIANSSDTPSVVEIATTNPQSADAVFRRTSSTAAWALLSLGFSIMIAFNMAVFRHMRRAYARRSFAARDDRK